MLGRLHPENKSAAVIGAGFAGLVAAYALLKDGYSVEIFEKENRCGGLLRTDITPCGPVESAAHSFRASPVLQRLCQDLNVPLTPARTRKKYILRDGQLKHFPLSPHETWQTFKKAFSAHPFSTGRTLAQWAKDYLGQAALDNMIAPLANGIYACSPDLLDQELAMPALTVPAGQSFAGALWRKPGQRAQIMAPLHGMGALTASLHDFIACHPRAKLHLNRASGALPDTANVVLATDASGAASLLEKDFPDDASLLRKIRYSPMVTATIFYSKDTDMPDGIGVLYGAREKRRSLGILFNSSVFPSRVDNPEKHVSFTMMLGGYEQPELVQADEQTLHKIVASEMKEVLGVAALPLSIMITRWEKAIPLYDAELKMTLAKLARGWAAMPGHVLAGNYTGQVSLRGMAEEWLDKS